MKWRFLIAIFFWIPLVGCGKSHKTSDEHPSKPRPLPSSFVTWDPNAQGVISSGSYTAFVSSNPLSFGLPSHGERNKALDPLVDIESLRILEDVGR